MTTPDEARLLDGEELEVRASYHAGELKVLLNERDRRQSEQAPPVRKVSRTRRFRLVAGGAR